MALLDDMALDQAGLFGTGELGLAVRYRRASGSFVACNVIINRYQTNSSDGRSEMEMATVYVRKADVTKPEVYDEVDEQNGTIWRVDAVVSSDGCLWELQVSTAQRMKEK